MNKNYVAGGTLRICPYTNSPEIVTFRNDNEGTAFDRSECQHNSKCTDDSCPLCDHLKG